MRLLLDTHLLLWVAGRSDRLSLDARALIGDRANLPVFSAVSLCEIAIKRSLNRPDFRTEPDLVRRALLDVGYEELALASSHAVALAGLPWIHRDPFDRILIAQAQVEDITLLTADPTIARYPGPIRRV